MANKFHGLFSLALAAVAILISAFMIFKSSIIIGTLFIVWCGITSFTVLRLFCAKCPSRESCGHVVPGSIATRLFRNVKPAPYTLAELVAFSLGFGVIVVLPQFWLYKSIAALAGYWGIMVFIGIYIKLNVCAACENNFCPANKKFQRFFS